MIVFVPSLWVMSLIVFDATFRSTPRREIIAANHRTPQGRTASISRGGVGVDGLSTRVGVDGVDGGGERGHSVAPSDVGSVMSCSPVML